MNLSNKDLAMIRKIVREEFEAVAAGFKPGDVPLDLQYGDQGQYGEVPVVFFETLRARLVKQGYGGVAAQALPSALIWDGIDDQPGPVKVQIGYNQAKWRIMNGHLGRRPVEIYGYEHFEGPTNGRLFPVRSDVIDDVHVVLTEGLTLKQILERYVEIVEEAIIDLGNDPGGIDFSPVRPK